MGSPGSFVAALRSVLLRDLAAVRREIEAYPDDASPWVEQGGMANPGGNLAMHLAGNLEHFIGHVLGGSDYVRDRDLEFAGRDRTRADIVAALDSAHAVVARTLEGMDDEALRAVYPQDFGGRRLTTGVILTQLAVHLAYHLGQLDAHRRAVTGDRSGVGAMSIAELPDAP